MILMVYCFTYLCHGRCSEVNLKIWSRYTKLGKTVSPLTKFLSFNFHKLCLTIIWTPEERVYYYKNQWKAEKEKTN